MGPQLHQLKLKLLEKMIRLLVSLHHWKSLRGLSILVKSSSLHFGEEEGKWKQLLHCLLIMNGGMICLLI